MSPVVAFFIGIAAGAALVVLVILLALSSVDRETQDLWGRPR